MEISRITNGTEMMTETVQNTINAKVENKEVSQKVDWQQDKLVGSNITKQ